MKTLFHVDPWLITETELHREDRAAADAATAAGIDARRASVQPEGVRA